MSQFDIEIDVFGGVIIEPNSLPENIDEFESLLKYSLTEWTQQGYKLVWLKIPIEKSRFIPLTVKLGFSFHHCNKDQITLTSRLIENAFIPSYASHFVGAGGVVISEKEELLVVLEKYDQQKRPQNYKLPGGLVEVGESLAAGVVREVFEETHIKAEFQSLVGFAHRGNWKFERAALYFVCRLRPLTYEITIDEKEIAEALWMPIADFLSHSNIPSFTKRLVEKSLNGTVLNLLDSEQKGNHIFEEFF